MCWFFVLLGEAFEPRKLLLLHWLVTWAIALPCSSFVMITMKLLKNFSDELYFYPWIRCLITLVCDELSGPFHFPTVEHEAKIRAAACLNARLVVLYTQQYNCIWLKVFLSCVLDVCRLMNMIWIFNVWGFSHMWCNYRLNDLKAVNLGRIPPMGSYYLGITLSEFSALWVVLFYRSLGHRKLLSVPCSELCQEFESYLILY